MPESSRIDEVADALAVLKQQRATTKGNITRIKKMLDNQAMAGNPIDLECRLEILSSYVKQIMAYQTEIEKLDPKNDKRSDIEELCISTKSQLLTLLGRNRPRENSLMENTLGVALPMPNKLPMLRLPKFDGKYSTYKNFMSSFNNLVNDEPTLSTIEKFNHLLTCLSGDALRTIQAFQVTDENYVKALERLAERYDKKCLIVFDCIEQIFELPKIAKPNASALRNVVDTVSAIYGSLQTIGSDSEITNALLIHLVLSKVDYATKAKWNDRLDYSNLPTWSECAKILIRRSQSLEVNEEKVHKPDHFIRQSKPQFEKRKDAKLSFSCSGSKNEPKCLHCNSKEHFVQECNTFIALPVTQRFDFAKKNALCINCLRKGHSVAACRSPRCNVCHRPHHTTLHRYEAATNLVTLHPYDLPASTSSGTIHTSQRSVLHASAGDKVVILATALVKIKDKFGKFQIVRALLDSGSQINAISEESARMLQLKRDGKGLNLVGIGEIQHSPVKQRVSTVVASRVNAYEFNTDFWVLKSITNYLPEENICTESWNMPKNIMLADPEFFKRQKVDILLGADIFFELLSVGQIKMGSTLPTLQKTVLGWIVSGNYEPSIQHHNQLCTFLSTCSEIDTSLDAVVRKFWECEEIPKKTNKLTEEHVKCEKIFVETTTLLPTGRFEVRLPFKTDPASLGLSFETAKRRFLSLERRLARTPDVQTMYHEFMLEYLALGHMSKIEKVPTESHYFIPHQCVVRPQSTTTKLRVVFDASCKTSSRISLNDTLMVGPTIQPDLYVTLIRFRCRKFAITADVTKMYRQILVHNDDRKFQLILWREKPSAPIDVYQLNTVTYGTSPAPFLAIRCLNQVGEDYKSIYPIGSKAIKEDFYVDDLMSGAETFEELEQVRKEVVNILRTAGFQLTKWYSNHPHFCTTETGQKNLYFNDTEETKALGIVWNPREDKFYFKFKDTYRDLKATKRNILSVSARLFDPLGLLCPFVTKAKILLQELWLQKLDWDESIPMHLYSKWNAFKENLPLIELIKIPRFVNIVTAATLQIHGFADASMRAYGCCFYVRSVNGDAVSSMLLTAKSKVAPLKTKTLPRLELCAAHLMTKVWQTLAPILQPRAEKVVFWTDSEIVLYWLRMHPSSLNTFVANRVAETQEWSSKATWRHVPTKENPADIASRGSDVKELANSIWFTGPKFLLKEPKDWPVNKHFDSPPDESSLEKKKQKTAHIAIGLEPNIIVQIIQNYSCYKKIIRIIVFIYRFIYRTGERSTTISVQESNWAFLKVVETIQQREFSSERAALLNNALIKTHLQRLNPFIHEHKDEVRQFSLLRVGGRLLKAPLSYDTRFPLLLPKHDRFAMLYARHLHLMNCHAGPKILLGLLRQKVWIVNARDVVRKIVRSCIHCFKYKPVLMDQIMGNLPYDRLRSLRPFFICGVDFCGPIYTSYRIRGRPPYKSYVAIFVCFSSKAVHIEAVSDLSTNSFLLVLKRFIGRRGLPSKIYCDNATNFVGANTQLKSFRDQFFSANAQQKLQDFATEEGMEFAFIPPRSPHFGGLWEAAVKSTKNLLYRTMANAKLTFEELSTILVEIEAILNSRPIAPMSEDPNDGEALTPAHLLIGSSLRALPDITIKGEQIEYSKRWQLITSLKAHFWSAFQRDFLLEQQQRAKWSKPQRNIEVGAVVMIHEDNLPPQRWMTGRVVAVATGNDGMVRVVDVKTQNGIYRRAIHKLALLPMTET